MKKIINLLIVAAAILAIVAVISRLTLIPVAGIPSRAIVGFAALLLLFAIALEGKK